MSALPEEKLAQLEKRFDSVEAALAAGPSAEEYVRLSKEYAELEPIVRPITAWRKKMEELRDEKFIIGSESGWKSFRSFVFDLCLKSGFIPQVVQEATSSTGILSLVAANMGISLYSESVRNFIRRDIAIVPVESTHATIEIVAAWNAAYQSPSFRLFHRSMEQELARLGTPVAEQAP